MSKPDKIDFHGGEMGERIRAFDWASTPIGPRNRWPASLCTIVDVLLGSHFPMALLWGPELILIYNDAYRIICGNKHPAALGNSAKQIWAEVWHIDQPIFIAVMERGETLYFEDKLFPIRRHDYTQDAFFTLSYSPVRTQDGSIGGALVVLQETTERKRSEEAVRESEILYRTVFENTEDGFVLIDPIFDESGNSDDYRILQVNTAWERLSGLRAEDFVGKRFKELLPNVEPIWSADFADVAKTGVARRFENHNVDSRRWYAVYAFPYGTGRAGVLFRDITERKQAEERIGQLNQDLERRNAELEGLAEERAQQLEKSQELLRRLTITNEALQIEITDRQRAEESLRQSEQRYRMLFESLRDAFVEVGMDGPILQFNDLYCQMIGYSPDEVRTLTYQQITPERWHEFENKIVQEQILPRGYSDIYEKEYRRKDGTIIPVELRTILAHDAAGQPSSMWAIIRDITERKRAEKELESLNDFLEQKVEQRTLELQKTQKMFLHAEKLAAVGKLSASIAHEFNNPLQGVLSILKGLKKRAILEEEDSELLDAAINESDRMKDLIKSLQDFNRPSTEQKEVMNVHNCLESLLLLHKSDFRNKQISLNKNYAENLPLILAVPDQIKQVFLNLITNAAESCQQPGSEITISTRKDKESVIIAICDTGTGINPDNIDKIFQPFFTTKTTVKGTGLGLSVSYGIVKSHGGKILVDSQPEKGTTFTIILPINGDKKIST